MSLDPDDPQPPYQQVANALRVAILSSKLAPGEKLPSGKELAQRYGVARMTVQQAIRVLRHESLVVTRQGSGVFVRERSPRPVALRPKVERAFEASEVSIDYAGFSGESLHAVVQEPLDMIRIGQLRPKSVILRILLPDTGQPWPFPCRVDDLADEPALRERVEKISRRHTDAITESVTELADLSLVGTARAEIRVYSGTPTFKLYVLNQAEAFFGFYPVTEHIVALRGKPVPIYDFMGRDVTLFHYEAGVDPAGIGAQYVEQARAWFDSMWATVSRSQLR